MSSFVDRFQSGVSGELERLEVQALMMAQAAGEALEPVIIPAMLAVGGVGRVVGEGLMASRLGRRLVPLILTAGFVFSACVPSDGVKPSGVAGAEPAGESVVSPSETPFPKENAQAMAEIVGFTEEEVSTYVEEFDSARVEWYEGGDLIAGNGLDSGVNVLGGFHVKVQRSDGSLVDQVMLYGTGDGLKDKLIQQLPGGGYVVLGEWDYSNPVDGHQYKTVGAHEDGYTGDFPASASASTVYKPTLSVEYDENGEYAKTWFYDRENNTFYGVQGGNGEGVEKIASLAEVGYAKVLKARQFAAVHGLQNYNLSWNNNGELVIVDSYGLREVGVWDGTGFTIEDFPENPAGGVATVNPDGTISVDGVTIGNGGNGDPNSTIEPTATPTAEVAMTPEKWQDFLNIEAVVWSDDGIKYNMGKEIANLSEVVSVEEVVKLPLGTPIVVFGADGMVTCGADPAEAAKLGQGGVIRVDTTTKELGMMPVNVCRLAYKAAVAQYKLGNKGVRLSFGEIGFTPMRANPLSLSVNDIVLEKAADGSIVSPILMKPKYYWLRKGDKMMESQGGDNWIQELIGGGYDEIEIFLTKPPQIIG